jgi:lysophospholipase L1-like esterase
MLAHVSRQRSLHWFLPASASVIAAGILATGAALALTGGFGEAMAPLPANAEPEASTREPLLLALGDSITQGAGDDRGGYAARVAEALRHSGKAVRFSNLAVGGAETSDVLAVLAAPEATRQVTAADVIFLSAAGNDFSHGLRGQYAPSSGTAPDGGAVGAATDEAPGEGSVFAPAPIRERAGRNLGRILTRIRTLNPHATIRVLGLYNPFDVLPADAPRTRAELRMWNDTIAAAAEPFADVVVIPIADLFAARTDVLAGDHYHPGPRGHRLIAERVLATLPGWESDSRER